MEYYPVLKEVGYHKMNMIQKNIKCILLSDKASLLKLGTVSPNAKHFGKGRI